jgi:hypothetical protein
MSDQAADGRYALTTPVILAHPHLVDPVQFKRNGKTSGEPKYKAAFVIPKDSEELKSMRALAITVAKAKWPTRDLKAEYAAGTFKLPFAKGDDLAEARKAKSGKDDGDWQRGCIVINAASKYRPALSILENGRVIDLEDDTMFAKYKAKFFFGAEVVPEFNFVAYEGGNGPDGVTAYVNAILATGKGKRIAGGGAPAAERFRGYIGTHKDEDPTGGADLSEDTDGNW